MKTGRAAAVIDLLDHIVTALLTALASRHLAGATLAVSTSVSHRGFLGSSLQVRPCASDCMVIFLSTDCEAPLPISHPHFGSGASSLQNSAVVLRQQVLLHGLCKARAALLRVHKCCRTSAPRSYAALRSPHIDPLPDAGDP